MAHAHTRKGGPGSGLPPPHREAFKKKGLSAQVRELNHKVSQLQVQAERAQQEQEKLSRQQEVLEEMIDRGGMWLTALPAVQQYLITEVLASNAAAAASALPPERSLPPGPDSSPSSSHPASPLSEHMATVMRACTPAYAKTRSSWSWQRWNQRLGEFCRTAALLLSQLDSPLAHPGALQQLEQAVDDIILDQTCLTMHYPDILRQANSRNCITGRVEAAEPVLWRHVVSKMKLDRATKEKLAAGYQTYAKVQAAAAAERVPLLQQLDQCCGKVETTDAGVSQVLRGLLDRLELSMKRTKQAGLTMAMILFCSLDRRQVAAAIVSSWPYWIAAVPICKAVDEMLQEEQQQEEKEQEPPRSGKQGSKQSRSV